MNDNLIRVSCSNLVRTELEGKIVLLLNQARAAAGKEVYTPPGGVICATDSGMDYLIHQLGCQFDPKAFEKKDLRFTINKEYLPNFERWFFNYKEREEIKEAAYREVKEEFQEEEKLIELFPKKEEVNLVHLLNVEERRK